MLADPEDWTRRVLIVDDDAFISGLVTELVSGAGFDVHMAHDATTALAIAESTDPDAAILDVELGPGPNGFDLADALLARMPHLAIVFLTQVAGPDIVTRVDRIPSQAAYLVKRDLGDAQAILRALDRVLTNGDPRPEFRDDERRTDPLQRLTPAQLETLRLVAEGLSNDEIATRRDTSTRAVEAMVSRIFAILDVSSDQRLNPRVAATRLYLDHAATPQHAEESA